MYSVRVSKETVSARRRKKKKKSEQTVIHTLYLTDYQITFWYIILHMYRGIRDRLNQFCFSFRMGSHYMFRVALFALIDYFNLMKCVQNRLFVRTTSGNAAFSDPSGIEAT